MKILVTLLVASLVAVAEAGVYNVKDFGAAGDGVTLDTTAIQKALNACGKAGGGTVEFPSGIYLSRPLKLRNATTVELDAGATLMAVTNPSDFMKTPGNWLKAKGSDFIPFISGKDLTDAGFIGGGTIDGSGAAWWPEAERARERIPGYTLPRPNLIVLERCRNVYMANITLQNSPKFNFVPDECEGVVVSNVTILAPERSPNTDGIDPSDSRDVLITKCHIDNGDDDVAIKAGHRLAGRQFASEDIRVTDCTFLHGHGMSIGSETLGGVRDVTVSNCVFCGTENGIRIKSRRGKGGLVEDIVYEDIRMTNVDPAVTFSCFYASNSAKDPIPKAAPREDEAQTGTGGEGTPMFRDIHVTNLTATCQRDAGIIEGLPESAISNVVFDHVEISAVSGMKIENAEAVRMKHVQITVQEGEPFILKNARILE